MQEKILVKKFRIVTISFDSDDTHEKMKKFAASHATDFNDWKFAVGDRETTVGLARDVGLLYAKVGDKFRHLNFFTIVDTEGKVYKQVYGKDFKPKTVLKYVNMASEKKHLWVRFVNIFDAIKAFCYTYDAKTGRYIPNYVILLPIVLGIFMQAAIVFLMVHIFRTGGSKTG